MAGPLIAALALASKPVPVPVPVQSHGLVRDQR